MYNKKLAAIHRRIRQTIEESRIETETWHVFYEKQGRTVYTGSRPSLAWCLRTAVNGHSNDPDISHFTFVQIS